MIAKNYIIFCVNSEIVVPSGILDIQSKRDTDAK